MSQPVPNHRNFPYASQPTGWFQLGWSEDFPAGVVVPVPGRPGPSLSDQRVLVAFGRGIRVRAPADVEGSQGAGAVASPARGPAGHRHQAGPQKIPLFPPDADADHDDDPGDDTGEEDRDSAEDDRVGHSRPPYLQPAEFPPALIWLFWSPGVAVPEKLETKWRVFETNQRLGLLV